MFFTGSESIPRLFFLLLVLPLGALAAFSSVRPEMANSVIFWAAAVYLLGIVSASLLQVNADYRLIWREIRLSILIVLFLLITAMLVIRYRKFVAHLFIALGIAVAISASINVYSFVTSGPHVYELVQFRLTASIGMANYANATNISVTYAAFFVGAIATMLRKDLVPLWRVMMLIVATILLIAILLTQTRSALLAVMVGLAPLILVNPLWRGLIAILAGLSVIVIIAALPETQEAIVHRGASLRPEVWTKVLHLIMERPFVGFGSQQNLGITLSNGEIILHAHNLVLAAWLRGGLVSLLAMTCLLMGSIYWAAKYWMITREIAPLCVIVTVGTAGMFDYELLATYPTWPWVTFWLPIGLCFGAEMAVRAERARG